MKRIAMPEIGAGLVKELREKTGAGMMDCKKALAETAGDVERAVDWLRAKGLAKAAKKAGRVAAEGLVGLAAAGDAGAIVEVNTETDFVGRNEKFQDFVRTVATLALAAGGDVEALKSSAYPGSGRTVAEELTQLVATIGENMNLRRAAALTAEGGALGAYLHGQTAPHVGKIGVLVALKSDGDRERLRAFGKQLAMHVAAARPESISREDLNPALVERERKVLAEQARASGKPTEVIDKMVEGRLRKFYEEACLLEQTFAIDGESKVRAVLGKVSSELKSAIAIKGFVVFKLGEGIDRARADFAAEVAAARRPE
jgi:elongation factor Ts